MRQTGASKMAQWVKVLAPKPSNLCLVPRMYKVEEKNRFPQVVL